VNKNEAHSILDRIRTDKEPMSIFITNEALRLTGDIVGVFDEPLRLNGNESRINRTIEMESQGTEGRFSYSRYLGSTTNKGT
jgi:hypothetical protein